MAFGILEPKGGIDVPGTRQKGREMESCKSNCVTGTVYMRSDGENNNTESVMDPTLKYDATGKICLVPQPSDDPNDPLVSKIYLM
jgi:hypothetical protein